ncbi:S8 family serine peptidase [Caballeronia sp. ATUFL_M2_KS44]|uniref:S8 family peptidase n=1 Tax=Caballeronia sp. ATUFL_M2_KS44 TaxID=2921767 RepID=UPI0020294756|nr:S8 family serine peptidase [Caballeronia sp. ATUFL_M2_KS44]
MMKRSIALMRFLFLWFGAGVSFASHAQTPSALSMKLAPVFDSQARERLWANLDKVSENSSLNVYASESVVDAVKRQCGGAPKDLVQIVRDKNPGVKEAPVDFDRKLNFIPCPYWYFGKDSKRPSIQVKEGENLANVLPLYTASSAKRTLDVVKQLNPGMIGQNNTVVKDGALQIPYVARNLVVPLPPTVTPQEASALALKLGETAAPAAVPVDPVANSSFGPNQYRLVEEAAWQSEDPRRDCNGPQIDTQWPVDIAAAVSALSDTLAKLKMKPDPGVVLIADTGLDVTNSEFAGALWTNSGVANNLPSVVENYTNDLHGASMVLRTGNVMPAGDYKYSTHGGDVARILLKSFDPAPTAERHVVAAIAKLNDEVSPYLIQLNAIPASFSYARQIRADVLNLSVVIASPDDGLRSALQSANFLVVAAAGNDGAFLDQKKLFPPAFPDLRERMLVVGAHDWSRELAPFSNRGTLVDVLAPGCAIPTTRPDGSISLLSGTSFAAPFVSQLAALLRSEGLSLGYVRTRILATADYISDIALLTRYGVELDVPRALRIRQDSIAFSDAKRTVLYGELDKYQSWTCKVGGTTRVFYPQTVVKVIPAAKTAAGEVARIWTRSSASGGFEEITCDAPLTEPLAFKKDGDLEFKKYDWKQVSDVAPMVWATN